MTQLHRFTALAISDVATLERSRVEWDKPRRYWKVLVRRQKNGKPIFLPIPDEVKMALDALPQPRGAAVDCPFYFWNAVTSRRAVIGIAERTMSAVFKKSGVKNAGSHRFRHTLATRLLGRGASFEDIADILGNTPEIVRKHYAKWSKGRQDRIDNLMLDYVGGVRQGEAEQNCGYSLGTENKKGCN
jgi:integrase